MYKNYEDIKSMHNENQDQNIWSIDPNTPEWLTKDYLEKFLKSYYENKQLTVERWQTKPAADKGGNYCGVLLRIKTELHLNDTNQNKIYKSFILKMPYQNDELFQRCIGPFDVFNCEINIYEQVVPKIKELLKEINDDEQIFAETLMMDREKSLLIFEDLAERDFFVPDRLQGFNANLIKLLLKKLAKFHATTAVLNERNQGSMEQFKRGMFNRYTDSNKVAYIGCFDAFCYYISKRPELCHLIAKFNKLKCIYIELLKRVFDPDPTHFNVLAHGDLWTTNVLVKYKENNNTQPIDMTLIDYQYSTWGSPAIDLWYTFNTSLCEDLHINKQEELVKYYYGILRETLEKLKYQKAIPSLHKFHVQLHEKAFYRFHCTCIILPLQRNLFTGESSFHTLMDVNGEGKRVKRFAYTNPYCQNIILQLLPLYENLGLLEIDQ